jgi:uncharacterized protein involved in exopolysaccharide biosynthesis
MMLTQYLRAAWRRRWMGVIVAWLVCGAGWVGVYLIPNQYDSTARLFVDAESCNERCSVDPIWKN